MTTQDERDLKKKLGNQYWHILGEMHSFEFTLMDYNMAWAKDVHLLAELFETKFKKLTPAQVIRARAKQAAERAKERDCAMRQDDSIESPYFPLKK